MATPLMWQTCRFSNSVYGTLLRYQISLQINPNSNSFRVERQHNRLKKFYISIFVITTITMSMINIIFEARVLNSIDIPLNMLIIHIAASFMSAFCICLLLVFLRFKDDVWDNFMNKLIIFDAKLFCKAQNKTNSLTVSTPNFGMLILLGNY